MNSDVFAKIEKKYYKKRPDVRVGDTVKLHMKIKEGSKERIQVFEGIVLSIRGEGVNKNIVVRKISYGIGVEKIVPLHLPTLEKIEVVKRGKVRRANIYYLRDRVGKRAMKISKAGDLYLTDEVEEIEVPEEGEAEAVEEEVVGNLETAEVTVDKEEEAKGKAD